jgi:transposase-like protein
MTTGSAEPPRIIPPAREGRRRRFSEVDKRQIVAEAVQPGASLSEVARRYGIAARVLFRWKQELTATAAPMFVTVEITDAGASSDAAPSSEERAPLEANGRHLLGPRMSTKIKSRRRSKIGVLTVTLPKGAAGAIESEAHCGER